jgi:hypothetical protein
MTKHPQISRDSAVSHQARSRQQEAIESRTPFQPDAQLTPFTRDTHQGIMIEWWDSCTNPKTALSGVAPC